MKSVSPGSQRLAWLRTAADRQRDAVLEHEQHYQQQVDRWRTARAEALALQRYNERTRQAVAQQRARAEQARLDELGLRRR